MAKKHRRKSDTFVCPHCGADVPFGASVCRECGSDDETGWSEGAEVWGAGIPAGYGGDEDFDYDEYVEQEHPGRSAVALGVTSKRWAWRVAVALLCLALLRYLLVH